MKHADNERDTSIERMLAKALRAQTSARATGDCLDAETIAAWVDDALPARERAAAQAHVADCERCQALVAAAIKTMPAPVARSPWRLSFMGWLVPLTVAAAAIAIWVNVNTRRSAESRAQATAPKVAAAAPRQDVALPSATAQPSISPGSPGSPGSPAPAAPQAQAPATARNKTTAHDFSDALAKREPAPPVTTPPAAPTESRAAAESAPAPAASPAPPLTETVGVAGGIAGGQRDAASKPQQGNASKAVDKMAPRAMMQGFASQEPVMIVSPDSAHRWRLLDSRGSVQHSSDGGTSWETQLMGANVSAGSSPSSSICWLVGRGGVVLLSTDGRTWTRIQFPEQIDLTSIRATDDRSATVTARDGRTFSTSDRGVSWTPQ